MATRGPAAARIVLTDDERAELEGWARRRTSAAGLALRAKIVLDAAEGGSNTELAARLGLDRGTIRKWRSRFGESRCDGLLDEPRPGRPRIVDDAQVEALITETLETTPPNATHWSTRSMAKHLGMSQSTVSRVWRAFGLAPHKQDSWKLSKDPLFVAKVRDVVGLYLNPPERALVLCVDEKTQIQALNRTAPVFPMLPGSPARASHDYVRHGTSSLYAALDLASGKVQASTPRWTSPAARSSDRCMPDIGPASSCHNCARSTPKSPPISMSTWSSTTPPHTRRQPCNAGCSPIPASSCTSPPPAHPGSTWLNAGSPN
jgi:transposase